MLDLRNISKSFPGVKALQNITVRFDNGEIHAVCGENGAGKSTLMKIICGIYQADSGEIFCNDEKIKLNGYDDAINHHISIVNQEINVVPNSSIAENICLDKLKKFTKLGFVEWKKINETAKKYMDMVELKMEPTTPVRHLSAAHKQLIQIAKALSSESEVVMLDEPTSSLPKNDSESLFAIMSQQKDQG
ncbi:MAG: ATP-binding cassette domain-containing protein [Parabacteroides sp.]|nr:ATP-binding cassette domain-containing protein [Parabacteroides sp.]